MREAYSLVWSVLVLLLRSRVSVEANIQRRHVPKRKTFSAMDRLIIVGLYRLVPNAIKALTIVKPDTVVRWHRAGFRSYWRWKSRKPLWPTSCTVGNSPADPKDEHRQPVVASADWRLFRVLSMSRPGLSEICFITFINARAA